MIRDIHCNQGIHKMGHNLRKPVFGGLRTTDPRSLISGFVIRVLETIISRLASSAIPIFWLVSVAEEAGLNLTLSETPKKGFLPTRPK